MIIDAFNDDGSFDPWNDLVQCDDCGDERPLRGSSAWLIPDNPLMPTRCPDCWAHHAVRLITWNIHCPNCQCNRFDYGSDDTGEHLFIVCTGDCRAAYLAPDGWHDMPDTDDDYY